MDGTEGTEAKAPSERPYFIPEGPDYLSLPENVQRALVEVVQPAYDEFVRGAQGATERGLGVSLTFLQAMEVIDQFDLVTTMTGANSGVPASDRRKMMDAHLRLLGSKYRYSTFLHRLQEHRRKQEKEEIEEDEPETGK